MDVETILHRFIAENFAYTSDLSRIDPDASFFESQLIDSTGILEIIHFIEEQFGVEVSDEEIVPENFDTVRRIAAFVSRKNAGKGAPVA